jgi:hypothetical protein
MLKLGRERLGKVERKLDWQQDLATAARALIALF